jgi:iron complex transport system substrate-binding protein
MKACSFIPAATSMIYQMGLEQYLYGVTFECPSDKPKVVHSYLEGNKHNSEEIESIVSQSKEQGKRLYFIDDELLQAISPDVIFTQDVCEVCQIDTSYVQRAVYKLKKQPLLVSLKPRNLDDVYQNAITIATALGEEEAAYRLLAGLKERTDKITDSLRKNNSTLRRVMIMEWLDPIYNCGHWIPYQIAQAGGVDMLSNPSGYSFITSWEKVLQYNPEVLVIAPCGFTAERTVEEVHVLTSKPGWNDLFAFKNGAIYFADADLFTQPGATLVDGIELLAALFHPGIFQAPEKLKNKYLPFSTLVKMTS